VYVITHKSQTDSPIAIQFILFGGSINKNFTNLNEAVIKNLTNTFCT